MILRITQSLPSPLIQRSLVTQRWSYILYFWNELGFLIIQTHHPTLFPLLFSRSRVTMLIQRRTVRLSTSVPMTLLRANWSRTQAYICHIFNSYFQVQLPLPQRDPVQPAVLHLRLVVQRGLLAGRGSLRTERGGGSSCGSSNSSSCRSE